MDFKYINDKSKTPSTRNRVIANSSYDSPFKVMPKFSTPPSRCTKIFNPFESNLHDTVNMSCSPGVFSTPTQREDKFKWTIEDISNLQPAEIDVETLSQHVVEEVDPHVEKIVQSKFDQYFSEKMVVPSPDNDIQRTPMSSAKAGGILQSIEEEEVTPKKKTNNSFTQTMLSLPFNLPQKLERALQPYFGSPQKLERIENTSLYQNLFEYNDKNSTTSSPALSTGLSPINFSPLPIKFKEAESSFSDLQDLKDCELSPISGASIGESRSVCRLNFSNGMNVDCSMIVPDIGNQVPNQSIYMEDNSNPPGEIEQLSNSTVNWDMEYNNVVLVSPSTTPPPPDQMDVSNITTPRSRMMTSQRKRLSDSFKEVENKENVVPIRESKFYRCDSVDQGYHTETSNFCDEFYSDKFMFASTPTKKNN